jgi:hypothetical protein
MDQGLTMKNRDKMGNEVIEMEQRKFTNINIYHKKNFDNQMKYFSLLIPGINNDMSTYNKYNLS